MATEIILPKVDMDMATGRISRWLVAEGAMVKQGDAVFEMETDKAAMDVEAPARGVARMSPVCARADSVTAGAAEGVAAGAALADATGCAAAIGALADGFSPSA